MPTQASLKEIFMVSCKKDPYNQNFVSEGYDQIGEETFWRCSYALWDFQQSLNRACNLPMKVPGNPFEYYLDMIWKEKYAKTNND